MNIVGEYVAARRRMPVERAIELRDKYGVPVPAIAAAYPVPARARFVDRERRLFEPDEDGRAVWLMACCAVGPQRPEEIEDVNPLGVVANLRRCVDLVAFHPERRDRFALRIGNGVVLGAVDPQLIQPDRVKVWSDIADWLRAGCSGLVLLTADCHQRGRILRRLWSIEAQQPAQVMAWIGLPAYPPGPPPAVFPMRAAA